MRIAFNNDDIDAIDQFLKKADRKTLTKYLFEVIFNLSEKKENFILHNYKLTLILCQAAERGSANSVNFIIDIDHRERGRHCPPCGCETENEQMRTPLHVSINLNIEPILEGVVDMRRSPTLRRLLKM